MTESTMIAADLLWRGALVVIPLAVLAALVCRVLPCRPVTRHTLWLIVMVCLIVGPLIARIPVPRSLALQAGVPTATPDHGLTVAMPAELPAGDKTEPVSGGQREPVPISVAGSTAFAGPDAAAGHRARPVVAGRSPAKRPIPVTAAAPTFRVDPRDAPPERIAMTGRPAVSLPPIAGVPVTRDVAVSESALTTWLARVATVRDAVADVPPLPAAIWWGGAGIIILGLLGRLLIFARVIRSAEPAPEAVTALVAEQAAALGLRTPPRTLVTQRRISPLVACGRRPRLILPAALWAELDDKGRRAVLLHELAHLKRRDHWIVWFQTFASCVYWWHPVVWWVRARLREEADLCCDAWVTAFLPDGRRAYAEALLQTRRYISQCSPVEPAIGLGVTTVRARRFARRITMVMTEQGTTKLTRRGLALTLVLAGAACVVAPVLACPPTPKDVTKAPRPPKAPKRPVVVVPRIADPAPPAETTTFMQYMQDRENRDGGIDGRINRLERAIEKLHERMERLLHGGGGGAGSRQVAPPDVPDRPVAPRPPRASEPRISADNCCDDQVREYGLPKGKLEALTALMVRDDVPVFVSPGDTAIGVHGNGCVQQVFHAFCSMIDGEEDVRSYRMSPGKLELLTELMSRSDVPILIEPAGDHIKVHGTSLEHLVFQAFVDAIEGRGVAMSPEPRPDHHAEYREHAPKSDGDTAWRRLEAIAREYETKARQKLENSDHYHELMEQLHHRMDDLQHEAERLFEHAGDKHEAAMRMLNEAAVLARASADEHAQADLMAQAERFEAEAEALEREAEAIEARGEELEAHAEVLEREAEAIERDNARADK